MKEKDLYPEFSRIVAKHLEWFPVSTAFEIKVARNNVYYLSQLEPHQLRALKMTKLNGVYHKISDESRVSKPYDAFLLKGDAYVVIYWPASKQYHFIDIDRYVAITSNPLREEESYDYATIHYPQMGFH
jgi:hypothetical protein